MQDNEIVELFWQREQTAILQTSAKYGKSLENTSYAILHSWEDAQECVQDTYFAAWNSMPTDRPDYLGAYLMKIIRNLSLNLYRKQHAQKRNTGITLIYEELSECIPDSDEGVFESMESGALAKIINSFLEGLDKEKRIVFVRRYFYSDSVKDISDKLSISESKVKSMLMRLRRNLAEVISREGFYD
ncbi:MAG: sigma-70 family RNA polymerase sigma factor [Ruminococcaceae bacterium]|nr:sigma-70 family RNA polymerase sigma factor [Oscillospiraceae bacterium]